MLWQPPLPDRYRALSDAELHDAIAARKAELGNDLVILGHHYQQNDVVVHADFTGDSFKLSQLAAQKVREVGGKYVVFCGVHFMAESADILTPDDVAVILPDLSAGCSMADMAAYDEVVDAWTQINETLDTAEENYRLIPITYMNSTAAIKAFVGEKGGAVCTSSNAEQVLAWAFAGGETPVEPGEQIKIIFLPDQHLGRNTAADMGYDVDTQMCLWDPKSIDALGGNSTEKLLASTMILWKGHCSVHKLFRPEHVDQIKAHDPEMRVIVHPECDHEVVKRADAAASTEGIIKAVNESEPGSRWAIGTEVHMVNRLAQQHPDKTIRMLSECQCLCTTMYRIDPPHLLYVLDRLAEGEIVNRVVVDDEVKHWSGVSLGRMLNIVASKEAVG
jgi:quinolinate synthase